jgi:hypothetical protein
MRNSMKFLFRIAIWAGAGFLVAASWGLYFGNTNKAIPIGRIVYTLTRLTQPVVAVIVSYEPTALLGLRSVIVWNAATYALAGLIVETIRRHYRPLQISN